MATRELIYKSATAAGLSDAIWSKFTPEAVDSGSRNGLWKRYNFGQLGALATDGLEGWVVTLLEGGGGGDSTITFTDTHGGAMVLTTDNADFDGINLQFGQAEMVKLTECEWFGMEARFKVSDADTVSAFLGLSVTSTAILAASSAHAISAASRVGAYWLDTSAVIKYTHDNATTDTEGTLATAADDTYIKVGFDVDVSRGLVRWYVNGALVVSKYLTLVATEMRPSLAFRTGSTAAKTMTLTDLAFGAYYK